MKKLLVFIPLILFLIQCQKERDKYYEKPDWVEAPLYEVLQSEGRFSLFLQLVDRTQYSASYKGNGLWTVFAPNDNAMSAYLKSKGYASVESIPQEVATKLVAYTMLYNKYQFNQLSDVLSGGWDTLISIKKKTPYYETVRREYNGTDSIWVVDANLPTGYRIGDNNYKYLPFYLDRYFKTQPTPLTATDYNTFYNSTYTGKNIQNASVVKENTITANGIIHEIDQIVEPLATLEKILDSDPYSSFKSLIEKRGPTGTPYFYSYLTVSQLTSYFRTMYPSKNIDHVYCKIYTGLAVPINNERYSTNDKETEQNGFSVFAPNNAAVQKFFDEKIKDYYSSMDNLPSSVLGYFINTHMVNDMVWPGGYGSALNAYGDFLNGVGTSGAALDRSVYTDIKPASNGFFYGSNDYIKSHYFETTYTEILLIPSLYSMLNNALQKYFVSSLKEDLMKCTLNGYTQEDYTVLLPTDELLTADGFTWAWISSSYGFNHSSSLTSADTRMQRLVRSHIFKRIHNNNIDTRITDFSGDPDGGYDGYAYAVNDYGDMIRYKDGKIQMLGNYDETDWVTVTPIKTFMNGQVFAIDKLLQYSRRTTQSSVSAGWEEQNILVYIKQAAANNPELSMYAEYMDYLMTNTYSPYTLSKESFFTLLMPNNTALNQAIADGVLKPIADVKSTSDLSALNGAIYFFKYHIIPNAVYVNDGYSQVLLSSGKTQQDAVVSTALKILIESTYLRMDKVGGNLHFTSHNSTETRSAFVVKGVTNSNLFGAKAVLHEIDNYLLYVSAN